MKKSAAKPKKKKSSLDPAVSLEHVRRTVDALRASGNKVRGLCGPARAAKPLAPEILARLRWPKGEPLPASLLAWLAYDAAELDVVDDEGRLRTTSLREFIAQELEEVAEELDEDDFDVAAIVEGILYDQKFPDAPALRLPDSASQAHFLVLDGSEEPPVLGYEKEEFWQKYESFGAFVAQWFGGGGG